MLSDWLAPNTVDWFVASHLGRLPYAAPGVARNAVSLFDWHTLDAVLASPLPVDLLTVAQGSVGPCGLPVRTRSPNRSFEMNEAPSHAGPLIAGATLIGVGMGGFVDGILFHQILQWHHMLSTPLPPTDLVNVKVNIWSGTGCFTRSPGL